MLAFYLALIEDELDQSKFKELFDKYGKLMLHRANIILKDYDLAEDAVQTAFLRIAKHIEKIDDVYCSKTKVFVVIVVENVAKNMYRKLKREKTVPFSEYSPAYSEDFSSRLIDAEFLAEMLEKLPENYRHILLLRYNFGFSYKEIADLMGIKEATARKQCERAKIALREKIEGEM